MSDAGSVAPGAQRTPQSLANAAELERLIDLSRCPDRTRELLASWGVTGEWGRRPTDLDGGKVFISPTSKVGVWVDAVSYPNSTIELHRFAPDWTIRALWDAKDCVPKVQPRRRQPVHVQGTEYVTDADLERLAHEKVGVLIYAWSPHMPLSVRGYPEAEATARKFGLRFLPVLDPEADARATERAIETAKLGPEAARRCDSIELSARSVHQHYPSTLVLSRGRFSKLYPGLWVNRKVYERFVKESLK